MKIVIERKGWFKQKWRFKIVSRNGRTLCASEKYYNRVDLMNAVDSIRREVGTSAIINKYF
jgi:uncharacterized protein YegP (UPF0339 family)